jgi:hypothetical protein
MIRRRLMLLAAVAAVGVFGIAAAPAGATTPSLLGDWNFASGSTADASGHWSNFTLHGSASLSGGLVVSGSGNGLNVATGWANASGYSGPTITDKTLVSWVRIDNSAIRTGSPLSLYKPEASGQDVFDAIDYAEISPYQWMAGSDFFHRTQSFVPGGPDTGGVTRQVAISYRNNGNGTETVTGCLDGALLGSYTTGNIATFDSSEQPQALFGPRHRVEAAGGGPVGSIDAHIMESRIYGAAMSCPRVAYLNDTTPPSISVSYSADGQNGWNVSSPVTETVSASDSGSGLSGAPSCTVDGNTASMTDAGGGSWTLPVSGEGSHAVSCSASDNAGNQNSATDTVNIDTVAPSVSVSHSADGQNGWNVSSPVTETVNAGDGGSGLASGSPSCTVDGNGATLTANGSGSWTFPVSGDGTHAVSCSASDVAGNSNNASDTTYIDTTPPVVTYTGNARTYTVADTVNITCSANDPTPGSGLTSNTCQNVSGDAYTFALGTNSYSATASDIAGNSGHGSTSFTVTVDPDSLCTLTGRWVTNAGVAGALCAKLSAAKAAIARGDTTSKNGQLGAYRNQLSAQSGKSIPADKAQILSQLSQVI